MSSSRCRSSKTPGEKAFGGLVQKELSKLISPRKLTVESLKEEWERVAGAPAARHSWISNIRRGRLVVYVDTSAWLYELTIRKKEISRAIGGKFGGRQVKEIQFRIGEME